MREGEATAAAAENAKHCCGKCLFAVENVHASSYLL